MKKINWHALLPATLALVAFGLSPDFYNKLPDHASHILAGISVIASTIWPSLFKKNDQ